ncbi:hypothetical protein BHE74_00049327, partial [Ensete ventricosum]
RNSPGVHRELAEGIGSLPGWHNGVRWKKIETRRKIVGGSRMACRELVAEEEADELRTRLLLLKVDEINSSGGNSDKRGAEKEEGVTVVLDCRREWTTDVIYSNQVQVAKRKKKKKCPLLTYLRASPGSKLRVSSRWSGHRQKVNLVKEFGEGGEKWWKGETLALRFEDGALQANVGDFDDIVAVVWDELQQKQASLALGGWARSSDRRDKGWMLKINLPRAYDTYRQSPISERRKEEETHPEAVVDDLQHTTRLPQPIALLMWKRNICRSLEEQRRGSSYSIDGPDSAHNGL